MNIIMDRLADNGWGFPILRRLPQLPLSLGLYGQVSDYSGNLKDHEIVQGTPKFIMGNAIDLKGSGPFKMRFAYPVTIDFVVVRKTGMGEDDLHRVRTEVFKKGAMFTWDKTKAAHWAVFPGVQQLWMMQSAPTQSKF